MNKKLIDSHHIGWISAEAKPDWATNKIGVAKQWIEQIKLVKIPIVSELFKTTFMFYKFVGNTGFEPVTPTLSR